MVTKMKCVKGHSDGLTEGKDYLTRADAYGRDDFVDVIDNNGRWRCWFRTRFEPVKDEPTSDPLTTQEGGSHYKDMAIQPIQYCLANNIPFAEGNVIKYVSRWRKKGGVQDLKKARHMLDVIIAQAEKEAAQ